MPSYSAHFWFFSNEQSRVHMADFKCYNEEIEVFNKVAVEVGAKYGYQVKNN